MEAYSLLVSLRKGMQSSSEQPLVGEERYVTTLVTTAKETIAWSARLYCDLSLNLPEREKKAHSF